MAAEWRAEGSASHTYRMHGAAGVFAIAELLLVVTLTTLSVGIGAHGVSAGRAVAGAPERAVRSLGPGPALAASESPGASPLRLGPPCLGPMPLPIPPR
jgi:hypothetical protein